MSQIIQIRRDTAANWTSVNPVLAQGEIGFETNTNKMKYGDGSTAWTSLTYFSGGSGITRSVINIVVNTAAGSSAVTDYDYNCTGALTLTLPTAIGNTNQYSVTRISGLTTIGTTAAQTINGSSTATIPIDNMTLTLVSNGSNWNIK